MSNWKQAYGWSGHILCSSDHTDSDPKNNVVAIPPNVFQELFEEYETMTLDERIQARQLGIQDISDGVILLATGSSFSEGFAHYGTVFEEAEARSAPGPQSIDHDAEYMKAMKEIYGLNLPPCRLMIGCASEH